MNIHIIACEVFYREISYLAATCDNNTSVVWLPQGLHDTPDLLRVRVQEEIDKIEQAMEEKSLKHNPDVIVLGYGLCSNGTVGLHSRFLPLVIPKTDDCIGIFLGSQETYLKYFRQYPGTYWLNNGWLENAFIPSQENYDEMFRLYSELYGEDNAGYLLEAENTWIQNYHFCGYLKSPVYHSEKLFDKARQIAQYNKWDLFTLSESLCILKEMLDGNFDEKIFLICPAGHQVGASFDEQKLCVLPLESQGNHKRFVEA